jgi:hypothetical protein
LKSLWISLILLLCYFLHPGFVRAEFDPTGWTWKTTITVPQGIDGFLSFPLDGPIFDGLLNPPHDLRLVDQKRILVPHAIRCGRTSTASETVTRPVKLLNRTYKANRFSRVFLDFGANVVKNRIKVELSGENYRRKATIEGGNDGVQWEKVADNLFLFDIHAQDHATKIDTLAFPENSFRYLRLTVENMKDDPERVEITNVDAFYMEPAREPQLFRVEIAQQNIAQDKKTSATVIELDLGFKHLPLHTVTLDIEDTNFHRAYTIEGRNTKTHKISRRTEEASRAEEVETPWNPVLRGVFYRMPDREKIVEATEATVSKAPYRFLRITIRNKDDSPLRIQGIRVDRQTCALVFEPQHGADYTLYGGNAKAAPPSYDFDRRAVGIDISTLPQATYGKIELLQPTEAKIPWSERYWYLITGFVIVAVILTLWMILPTLKKETGSGEAP